MKHIRKIAGLMLSLTAALSLTVPAFASDYSFTTDAPQDFYGSTSYEDVCGSQYNYGGKNVVDYQVPELPSLPRRKPRRWTGMCWTARRSPLRSSPVPCKR